MDFNLRSVSLTRRQLLSMDWINKPATSLLKLDGRWRCWIVNDKFYDILKSIITQFKNRIGGPDKPVQPPSSVSVGYQDYSINGELYVVRKIRGQHQWVRIHQRSCVKRKAPPNAAKSYSVGTIRTGCDSKQWVVRQRSTGRYWARMQKK